MASIYMFLGLMALIFAGFGFCVHAFYFASPKQAGAAQEAEELRRNLLAKEAEVQAAQAEVVKTGAVVRSLEERIRRRNAEMEELKQLAARQDEAIEMLQSDAEALRMAVSTAGSADEIPEQAESSLAREDGVEVAGERRISQTDREDSDSESCEIPLVPPPEQEPRITGWKDNLNNILNILNSMEKEVQK